MTFNKLKIIAVIPARFSSTRLPGKPLLMLKDKPMYYWVFLAAKSTNIFDKIIVATDNNIIANSCIELGVDVELTSNNHLTGTDRVVEVAMKHDADIIVNIQGDEPLIEPNVIKAAVDEIIRKDSEEVVNLMTRIVNPVELINNTVPKVIVDIQSNGLYLSRSAIPYPKGSIECNHYKQVCVYAFRRTALLKFSEFERGQYERIEDIEILRYIENGVKVKFIEVDTNSIAVDTMKDYIQVKKMMENDNE